jgi:hypothetical protein
LTLGNTQFYYQLNTEQEGKDVKLTLKLPNLQLKQSKYITNGTSPLVFSGSHPLSSAIKKVSLLITTMAFITCPHSTVVNWW